MEENQSRSDNISEVNLENWFVNNDFYKILIDKLYDNQLRLIEGPRGTGKTHLMRYTYLTSFKNKKKPVVLFVSLNKYFYLFGSLINAPNAIQIFHSWILSLLYNSCYDYIIKDNLQTNIFGDNKVFTKPKDLTDYINILESPNILNQNKIYDELTIGYIKDIIHELLIASGRNRAVILFDDAALTLSPKFFEEFLDIFKNFKSEKISPKASVYPATDYKNPKVHINHEGSIVNCWMDSEDIIYLETMKSIAITRYPDILYELGVDILELFCYAAFGVPRNLFNLINYFRESTKTTKQSKINESFEFECEVLIKEYLTLKSKKPEFATVVENGSIFFFELINILKKEADNNLNLTYNTIAIKGDANLRYENKMLDILEEVGLLYKGTSQTHGIERKYNYWKPNLSFLIYYKVFSKSRGFNIEQLLHKLKDSKKSKHPIRRDLNLMCNDLSLNFSLNLPPCQNCGTIRLNEIAKFCHNCGSQLITKSSYDSLLDIKIKDLPFTKWQIEKLENNNFIRISDILTLSNPSHQLQDIKGIGKIKSSRISSEIKNKFENEITYLIS